MNLTVLLAIELFYQVVAAGKQGKREPEGCLIFIWLGQRLSMLYF